MRYLPKSPSERQEMLAAIGARSDRRAFSHPFPKNSGCAIRCIFPARFPKPEIIDYFQARAAENSRGYTSFLGAGVYNHLRSVVTDALIQRGEFLTSYTPYQAEIAQGTLQRHFRISNVDVPAHRPGSGQRLDVRRLDGAHRSRADGRAAHRPPPRSCRALRASRISPGAADLREKSRPRRSKKSATPPPARSIAPRSNAETLDAQPRPWSCSRRTSSACSKKFPQLAEAGARARALCWSRPSPKPFRSASCGRPRKPISSPWKARASASPPSYGGPYVGVIATRDKFVRQMPGRLAGQTTDAAGRRGFVLTLATREQHIRREKATSNICTNEALYALAATIHLCLLGKEGLRELALQNLAKARFAQAELEKIPGVRRVFTGPTFNEFVAGVSALGENDQRRAAARKNHRPARRSARIIRS